MKSSWLAVVIIFVVIAVLASSITLLASLVYVAVIVVAVVVVIAGLIFIATHLKPPAWVYLVYAVAWLVIPGVTLAVSLFAGICAGAIFFMEKLSK